MEFSTKIIDNELTIVLSIPDPLQCLKFSSAVAIAFGKLIAETGAKAPEAQSESIIINKMADIIQKQDADLKTLAEQLKNINTQPPAEGVLKEEPEEIKVPQSIPQQVNPPAVAPMIAPAGKKKVNRKPWTEEQREAARKRLAERREKYPERFAGNFKKKVTLADHAPADPKARKKFVKEVAKEAIQLAESGDNSPEATRAAVDRVIQKTSSTRIIEDDQQRWADPEPPVRQPDVLFEEVDLDDDEPLIKTVGRPRKKERVFIGENPEHWHGKKDHPEKEKINQPAKIQPGDKFLKSKSEILGVF